MEFAEELQCLTKESLDPKSLEQMALSYFLSPLNNPQLASAVKQQGPKMLKEAIHATLEKQSYLLKAAVVGNITPEVHEYMVGAIGSVSGATGCIPQS